MGQPKMGKPVPASPRLYLVFVNRLALTATAPILTACSGDNPAQDAAARGMVEETSAFDAKTLHHRVFVAQDDSVQGEGHSRPER
jgi:hypothetical protein